MVGDAYYINGQGPTINISWVAVPKRLPVPEVASHLVCSVCRDRNSDNHHPIWAKPDARVPGVIGRYPDFINKQ